MKSRLWDGEEGVGRCNDTLFSLMTGEVFKLKLVKHLAKFIYK